MASIAAATNPLAAGATLVLIVRTNAETMFRRSDYLIATSAILAFLLSNYLWFTGNKQAGLYVGIWVPSLIAAGIYLKLILHRGVR